MVTEERHRGAGHVRWACPRIDNAVIALPTAPPFTLSLSRMQHCRFDYHQASKQSVCSGKKKRVKWLAKDDVVSQALVVLGPFEDSAGRNVGNALARSYIRLRFFDCRTDRYFSVTQVSRVIDSALLSAHRYRWRNPVCPRKAFGESLPGAARTRARQTGRISEIVRVGATSLAEDRTAPSAPGGD